MKKFLILVTCWIGLCLHVQAGAYVYDSSVKDWYSEGTSLPLWLVVTAPSTFFVHAKEKNQIGFTNGSADWHLRVKGDFAGADWQAPAGEVITKIEFVYTGVYGLAGAPQLAVFGGTSSPGLRLFVSNLKDIDWEDGKSETQEMSLKAEANYKKIRLCAWYCDPEAAADYFVHPNWFSKIVSVKITTEPQPEP